MVRYARSPKTHKETMGDDVGDDVSGSEHAGLHSFPVGAHTCELQWDAPGSHIGTNPCGKRTKTEGWNERYEAAWGPPRDQKPSVRPDNQRSPSVETTGTPKPFEKTKEEPR